MTDRPLTNFQVEALQYLYLIGATIDRPERVTVMNQEMDWTIQRVMLVLRGLAKRDLVSGMSNFTSMAFSQNYIWLTDKARDMGDKENWPR
jgi:hypothetical protein